MMTTPDHERFIAHFRMEYLRAWRKEPSQKEIAAALHIRDRGEANHVLMDEVADKLTTLADDIAPAHDVESIERITKRLTGTDK